MTLPEPQPCGRAPRLVLGQVYTSLLHSSTTCGSIVGMQSLTADLDLLLGNGQPGGHAIDDATNALAVRLPKGGHSEGMAERVAAGPCASVPLPLSPVAAPVGEQELLRAATMSAAQKILRDEAPHMCCASC